MSPMQDIWANEKILKKPFLCVKCGLGHPTPNCPNNIERLPKCVRCLKHHTAYYRACKVYENVLKKKLSKTRTGKSFLTEVTFLLIIPTLNKIETGLQLNSTQM